LSGIQNELGPKGFQAIESAINENPDVPGFVRQFRPTFPVGTTDNLKSYEFMQFSTVTRYFVPFMVFIDRQGMIRVQYTGSDTDFFNTDIIKQSANIREQAEKLLNEPQKAARPTTRKKTTLKKPAAS
jgi:hypothetical protein